MQNSEYNAMACVNIPPMFLAYNPHINMKYYVKWNSSSHMV